jgi:hypothetical protein
MTGITHRAHNPHGDDPAESLEVVDVECSSRNAPVNPTGEDDD